MNREEQILAAAKEYAGKKYRNDDDRAFAITDFQAGAQWADNNQQWHKADDFPPRGGGEPVNFSINVLAINTNGEFLIAFYDFIARDWINFWYYRSVRITHWMFLPKSPNVEPKK